MKKRLLSLVALVTCLASAETVYNETDGMVIMEIENTGSPLGLWEKKTDLAGYTGSGYLEFTGNNYSLGDASSPLEFHFKINQGGTYLIDLHCAKMTVEGHTDWANDSYVRVIGDFTSEAGPHDLPGGNASLHMLKTDTKYFGGKSDAWEWATGDFAFTEGRLDPGGKKNKRRAVYNFKSGETYTLVVSGRSKSFRIDRIVFRRTTASRDIAQNLDTPESIKVAGTPPMPDQLDITVGARDFDTESNPGDDTVIQREAELVRAIKDGSWIRFADFDFGTGQGGCIDIDAANANAASGTVEVRTDAVNGPLLATVPVHQTWAWTDNESFSANLAKVSGRKDLYFVFKGGGDEFFRFRGFMIRSGETVDEKLAVPPIRPPAGRLAYVADGNSPDPDDIGGTAAALAMLRAAGLESRLVYGSHSCDLVKASNITTEMELLRQQMMQTSCDGTVSRWGGFEGLTFWNCRTQQAEAISELKDQINASSASDPLWIIEAGEPDIIGYALEQAEPSKRQFVKLLTHHSVNDSSGDYFKWGQMLDFGFEEVRIPDQNGRRLNDGLQRPEWAFNWARDHADSRIRWIWEQGKIAEEDPVVGFQKSKIDISDAGMVFYWITGANQHGGYRTPSVHEVRQLLERHL